MPFLVCGCVQILKTDIQEIRYHIENQMISPIDRLVKLFFCLAGLRWLIAGKGFHFC